MGGGGGMPVSLSLVRRLSRIELPSRQPSQLPPQNIGSEIKKLSKHFTDEDSKWPKAKLTSISFGPKMNHFTSGKSIGIVTDLNIYSYNIGNQAAMAITGEGSGFPNLQRIHLERLQK